MAVIKVQKIPKKKIKAEDVLSTFCYHFPQYKYHEAKKLPYKRILQMLRVAKKEHTKKMLDLLSIISAPHSKNGSQVKKLSDHFNDILNE